MGTTFLLTLINIFCHFLFVVGIAFLFMLLVSRRNFIRFTQKTTKQFSKMSSTSATLKPPVAERIEHVQKWHGKELKDYYHWMRDDKRKDPKVLAHLKSENEYTKQVLAPTKQLHDEIFKEFKSRLNETDTSAPFHRDQYEYFTRTIEGKEYQQYCRRSVDNNEEEILLDLNVEHVDEEYRKVWSFKVSPDHKRLAYTIDFSGGEDHTLYVKDLVTKQRCTRSIEHTMFNLEWSADSTQLYFDKFDSAKRPFQIWRTTVDEHGPGEASKLLEEPDGTFELHMHKTSDGQHIVVESKSGAAAGQFVVDATEAHGEAHALIDRSAFDDEHMCSIDHWQRGAHAGWFILSNKDDQANFALYFASAASPADWRAVLPYNEQHYFEHMQVFKNHLVLFERSNALMRIKILDLKDFPNVTHRYLKFDEAVHHVKLLSDQNYEKDVLRFVYSSPITPDITYECDLKTLELKVLKKTVVPNYDASLYQTERLWATSHDGALIPISVLKTKDADKREKKLLHLYGYGSYGLCKDPVFDSKVFSLLSRGFIYAVAHVRGSAILGRTWYLNGKYEHKKNTFLDFIACADTLVAKGMTSHELLSIEGRSAGGLLVGASLNMRPDLCRAALNDVGFVDVLNTMLDESIPLTREEFTQWGNPKEKKYFDVIREYCPYTNLTSEELPHLLVKAGLFDPRVGYWEPSKYVAKARYLNPERKRALLLHVHLHAGHFSSSGRYAHLQDYAGELAFLVHYLNKDE